MTKKWWRANGGFVIYGAFALCLEAGVLSEANQTTFIVGLGWAVLYFLALALVLLIVCLGGHIIKFLFCLMMFGVYTVIESIRKKPNKPASDGNSG